MPPQQRLPWEDVQEHDRRLLSWPQTQAIFRKLDLVVNSTNERTMTARIEAQRRERFQWIQFSLKRIQPMLVANEMRMGSIAAWPTQVDYYFRIAASPAVRTVCEIGFNAGHSAAVWMSASDRIKLDTFDLFETQMGRAALEFLQAEYPGRINAHAGDSQRVVPLANITDGHCDVVHVDGRHQYDFVIHDFLNIRRAP